MFITCLKPLSEVGSLLYQKLNPVQWIYSLKCYLLANLPRMRNPCQELVCYYSVNLHIVSLGLSNDDEANTSSRFSVSFYHLVLAELLRVMLTAFHCTASTLFCFQVLNCAWLHSSTVLTRDLKVSSPSPFHFLSNGVNLQH